MKPLSFLPHRQHRVITFLQCLVPACLLLLGCPRRFDPRAQEFRGVSPEQEAAFRKAEQLLRDGKYADSSQHFAALVQKIAPGDKLHDLATIYWARSLRLWGQPGQARQTLSAIETKGFPAGWLGQEFARELGLVEYAVGRFDAAQKLLAPLSGDIVDGDEAAELHLTLADVYGRAANPQAALSELELVAQSRFARPGERFYLHKTALSLCGRLPESKAASKSDLLCQKWLAPVPKTRTDGRQDTLRIGLLLPFSGKDRLLGEKVLRGALLAADFWNQEEKGPRVELRLRDSNQETADKLLPTWAQQGVQTVLTPLSKNETLLVAEQAGKSGLLAVGLGPVEQLPGGGLQLSRSAKQRTVALAQHLLRSDIKTVAILSPSTPYGQAQSRAFVEALQGSAVQVLAELSFGEQATTFLSEAKQLDERKPEALFLPVSATQLELIAAQLASAGLLFTARVNRATLGDTLPKEPPIKLLLSLAEGMSPRMLKTAGRYLQGAVLSPLSLAAFPAAQTRAVQIDLGDGEEPTSLDALGYDAVRLLRAACQHVGEQNRCTAQLLGKAARQVSIDGATGRIAFEENGQRAGGPPLLRVRGQDLEAVLP